MTNNLIAPVKSFPALLLRKGSERVLVVADLHIGWEVSLAEKGIHVPSQTERILEKMMQAIELCRPTSLVFLGDVKHAVAKVELREWKDIPDFFETISRKVSSIRVIPGNHDGSLKPLLPKDVEILPSKGAILWNVGFFHGHAWPAPELLGCRDLVTAHVHPMVAFRDLMGFRLTRQVWVKAVCNCEMLAEPILKRMGVKTDADAVASLRKHYGVRAKASSRFLIMPSFNDFLGGQTVNKKSLSGKGRSGTFIGPVLRFGSVDVDHAETYLLDGTFVGRIEQLRKLS